MTAHRTVTLTCDKPGCRESYVGGEGQDPRQVRAEARKLAGWSPLQLGFTSRYVRLYTNPGETVFSAFGGVGSELYVAVKHGRRALGIELKASYWQTGCRYLKELEAEIAAPKLTDMLDEVHR